MARREATAANPADEQGLRERLVARLGTIASLPESGTPRPLNLKSCRRALTMLQPQRPGITADPREDFAAFLWAGWLLRQAIDGELSPELARTLLWASMRSALPNRGGLTWAAMLDVWNALQAGRAAWQVRRPKGRDRKARSGIDSDVRRVFFDEDEAGRLIRPRGVQIETMRSSRLAAIAGFLDEESEFAQVAGA